MLSSDQKQFWQTNGYLAIPGFYNHADVEQATAVVERLFANPPGYLVVDNTVTGLRSKLTDVPRTDRSPRMYKLNDLYLEEPVIRELALGERLRPILAELLGEPAVLCNSLNFENGSQQPEHIDSLFMTPRTPNKLVATWIAIENAHPDAGQLFYYPGSHTIPLYTFRDGTHHAQDEELPAWHTYINAKVAEAKLERTQFPAKKGDLFIWSANLVHGGSPIRDADRTRKSLVCHYYTESDSRALGYQCINHGGNSFWVKREHPPLPGTLPFRKRVGKWLRRGGLYRTMKKLTG